MVTVTTASTYTADDVADAKRLAGRDWNKLTETERHRVIQLQRVHGLLGPREHEPGEVGGEGCVCKVGPFLGDDHTGTS